MARKTKIMQIKKGKRIIRMWEHKSWGNTIAWFDFDRRRLVGWLSTTPRKGDYVFGRLAPGDVYVWKITRLERQDSPGDMFFADAKDIGYLIPANR